MMQRLRSALLRLSQGLALLSLLTACAPPQPGERPVTQRAETRQQDVLPEALARATPESLTGQEVINADGTVIGRITAVQVDQSRDALRVVIATRSMQRARLALGLGQLTVRDGRLWLTEPMSQDQIDEQLVRFEEERYAPVEEDRQIAELAERWQIG